MKLTKKQFCNAVRTYERMLKEDYDIHVVLDMGPEWKPSEWINNYYELLSELSECVVDPLIGTDLDWFCFETDFGRRKEYCKVTDNETGLIWTIETPDILYDFITRDE